MTSVKPSILTDKPSKDAREHAIGAKFLQGVDKIRFSQGSTAR